MTGEIHLHEANVQRRIIEVAKKYAFLNEELHFRDTDGNQNIFLLVVDYGVRIGWC